MVCLVAVERENLRTVVVQEHDEAPGVGDVLLGVRHFALTANNVTYAAFGESMSYWDFFPTAAPWGLAPVWGFADVLESQTPGIALGERFYGYFPMADRVRMDPTDVTSSGFTDGAEHRRSLTAGYNRYLRVSADPLYATTSEELQMLLRPLFLTAYAIDDWVADNDGFGARRAILSSASSKTAYATAFLMRQRGRLEVVGLTSANNTDFVRELGCYDRVLTYDEVDSLNPDEPAVFVDMAANGRLRAAIHQHFQDSLKLSCAVGATHWDNMLDDQEGLPGPRPKRFFVPSQIQKRVKEWGAPGLQRDFLAAWMSFVGRIASASPAWIRLQRQAGADEVARTWLDLVEGRVDPRQGNILSLP